MSPAAPAPHHFFHSFPRPREGETREAYLQRGFRILELMFDVGLALAPERIAFKQPVIGGHKQVAHLQNRICFTELAEDALSDHAAHFGPFALRFDTDELRRQGALPTIYIPQHIEGDRGLSAVGANIVAYLDYTQKTMEQLQNLFHLSHEDTLLAWAKKTDPSVNRISPDAVGTLNNTDDAGKIVASNQVPIKQIRAVLDFVGYKNAPYDAMAGILRLIQNLFYPTDDQIHDDALSYYRQREWRIIAGFGVPAHGDQTRDPTAQERDRLLAVDEVFWNREMQHDGQKFHRIDRAKLIPAVGHWGLLKRVNAIVCPAAFRDEIHARFKLPVVTVE